MVISSPMKFAQFVICELSLSHLFPEVLILLYELLFSCELPKANIKVKPLNQMQLAEA